MARGAYLDAGCLMLDTWCLMPVRWLVRVRWGSINIIGRCGVRAREVVERGCVF